ncbi:MAG: hypothetical protein D6725_14360 [Planctomycetota bacterium]|nr:MAG: hypothetical protein D6725_14360 [Planctomycetota bacterium]
MIAAWLALLAMLILRGPILRGLGYVLGLYLRVRRSEEKRRNRPRAVPIRWEWAWCGASDGGGADGWMLVGRGKCRSHHM